MKQNERKVDTRNKIELGGLIIKAKLGYLQKDHKDVILGALIDIFNKIHDDKEGGKYFSLFKQLGAKAFMQNDNRTPDRRTNENLGN